MRPCFAATDPERDDTRASTGTLILDLPKAKVPPPPHTYRVFAADVGLACSTHTHTHTEAHLKPSNEICNVVLSFLSFKGGIERRGGLGLYYHTPWREGPAYGGRKGLLKEK